MRFSFLIRWCLAAVLVLAGAGCDRGTESESLPAVASVGADHRFTIDVGGQAVKMRLAAHEYERNRGLMQVPAMPEDEGMLFVFPKPQRMSFYMRNTRIPLDIGYYSADGVLREVHPMHPFVEDSVRSESESIQLALEMNQGWYTRHGVRPGSRIDIAAVRAALHERGFEPGQILGGG